MSKEIKSCDVHLPDGEVRKDVRLYDYPLKGDYIDLYFGQGIYKYSKRFEVIHRVFDEVRITPHSISGGTIHIYLRDVE